MKYRIVKRTDVWYGCGSPKRRYWYVIQQRIVTILFLWIPVWMDMNFQDYGDSIMSFDKLSDAKDYLKKLKKIKENEK